MKDWISWRERGKAFKGQRKNKRSGKEEKKKRRRGGFAESKSGWRIKRRGGGRGTYRKSEIRWVGNIDKEEGEE